MGITGLLPFLEQATRPCHISEFRGATCVIDAYCWLHKGANACAIQLSQGEDTQIYVQYCLKYVKMLQDYDIRPILVFDGKNLPAKSETEAKRRESRNKAKQRAAELLRIGKTEEARTYLKQCINVTPDMASAVIKKCHTINVDCIVAPYESDAQLAFFNVKGVADIVITEDSDLVLFGCSKVLFKLDLQGRGYLVDATKIPDAMQIRPDRYTFDKFRYMCILSGCDYIESLRGIGLKKAQKFITLTEETDPEKFLDKLPRYLNMRHLKITAEYKENFMVADATFRHQTIFDPFKKKLLPLTDPAVCGTNPKYCKNAGDIFDHDKAYQIALGNLHPTTFKQLDNWVPADMVCITYMYIFIYKTLTSHFRDVPAIVFGLVFIRELLRRYITMNKKKIEEDLVIAKELEFYSSKREVHQTSKTDVTEDIEEPPTSESSTSPVFQRNPFLKKKLSRFQETIKNNKVVIKSRYFSSQEFEEKIEVQKKSTKTMEYSEVVTNLGNCSPNEDGENKQDLQNLEENSINIKDEINNVYEEFTNLPVNKSEAAGIEAVVLIKDEKSDTDKLSTRP
ncbi:hypothetical protein NQ317_006134, partial [Molorchus minor]